MFPEYLHWMLYPHYLLLMLSHQIYLDLKSSLTAWLIDETPSLCSPVQDNQKPPCSAWLQPYGTIWGTNCNQTVVTHSRFNRFVNIMKFHLSPCKTHDMTHSREAAQNAKPSPPQSGKVGLLIMHETLNIFLRCSEQLLNFVWILHVTPMKMIYNCPKHF